MSIHRPIFAILWPVPDDLSDDDVQRVATDAEAAWRRRFADEPTVIRLEEQAKVNGEWLFPEDEYHRFWRVSGPVRDGPSFLERVREHELRFGLRGDAR